MLVHNSSLSPLTSVVAMWGSGIRSVPVVTTDDDDDDDDDAEADALPPEFKKLETRF